MVKIDELKKEKLQALKEKNTNKSNLLSVIISNFQLVEIEKKAKGENVSDETMLSVLNKVLKGLNDEREMFDTRRNEVARNYGLGADEDAFTEEYDFETGRSM